MGSRRRRAGASGRAGEWISDSRKLCDDVHYFAAARNQRHRSLDERVSESGISAGDTAADSRRSDDKADDRDRPIGLPHPVCRRRRPAGVPALFFVPSLHEAIRDLTNATTRIRGGELYLLRPRRADGTLTADTNPNSAYPYNETSSNVMAPDWLRAASLCELGIPVDSVDFAGLTQNPEGGKYDLDVQRLALRSSERCARAAVRLCFPGRWDVTHPWEPVAPTAAVERRQEGIQASPPYAFGATDRGHCAPTPAIRLGVADPTPSYANPFYGILGGVLLLNPNPDLNPFAEGVGVGQIAPADWAGWNRLMDPAGATVTPNPPAYQYPFGGFGRNGDILQVMFAGSYRIRPAGSFPAIPPDPTFWGATPRTSERVRSSNESDHDGL